MIGPVQLLVVGFDKPDFQGEVLAHLQKLREHDVVRVIDILVVNKDADGVVETVQITGLSDEEIAELGAVVEALVGLAAAVDGDGEGAAGLWAGEDSISEEHVLDVLDEIPNDTAVAIALLEHRWAIPLREAIMSAGGFPIIDSWLHPRDLVEVGLLAAAEAEQSLS
jgi:uncharacterized membrane protein